MSLEDQFDDHLESEKANAPRIQQKAAEKQEEATDKNAPTLRVYNLVIKPELEKAAQLFREKIGAQAGITSQGRDPRTSKPCLLPTLIVPLAHGKSFLLSFLFHPVSGHITVYQKCPFCSRVREPDEIVLTFAEADETKIAEVVESFVKWSLGVIRALDKG